MKAIKHAPWLGILISGIVSAGPADYIYTPLVEHGEREIDFKYGYAKNPDDSNKQAASLGFGWGATEFWFTELYLKYEKQSNQGTHLAAVEWENKFQLTEAGKYPVDVGLITELEIPRERSDPYEFKIGPLFQTEFGKLQLNANLLFEREFHDDQQHDTEMGYQWQAKYRWQPALEVGLQGLGAMGKWNDWDTASAQKHSVGPALFGKVSLGGRQFLRYNAAWLVGTSDAAPDDTFRMQTEYEF